MHLIYAFFKLTNCRKLKFLKNVLGESFRFLDNSISAQNSYFNQNLSNSLNKIFAFYFFFHFLVNMRINC